MAGLEIERKFVIKKPDIPGTSELPDFSESRITQTYLLSEVGVTHRVRAREKNGDTVYTECEKRRLSVATSIEDEREITEDEYQSLLSLRDPSATTIEKRRVTFSYSGRLFEVDIYPAWEKTCIMEVELPSEDAVVDFPPFITLVKEVTGDKRYSNAGMARHFPEELV